MSKDCLFCSIARDEVPSSKVHEDDSVIAFRDVNPQAPTHLLVIPRTHIASFAALEPRHAKIWTQMQVVAQELAQKEGIDIEGYRVVTNVGKFGGQTVRHLHLHLLGGRPMTWPPG